MIPKDAQKTPTETEFDLVSPSSDPYKFYRGKCVEIRQSDQRHAGIYQGLTNHGQLVLKPHVNYPAYFGKREVAPIWDNRPSFVTLAYSLSILPQSESHLKDIILAEQMRIDGMSQNHDSACLI